MSLTLKIRKRTTGEYVSASGCLMVIQHVAAERSTRWEARAILMQLFDLPEPSPVKMAVRHLERCYTAPLN